ncbi:hypothetical protein D3C76_1071110 [compost metagenome]
MIASHGTGRRRDLANRHNRGAVAAVQYIQAALLGRRDQRRLDPSGSLQVDQGWLAANVHVPQVVVSELIVPADPAAVEVQRDDAGTEFLCTRGTAATPLVRRLVAEGEVDQADFFVDAGQRPHVR